VFISPVLDDPLDAHGLLATLRTTSVGGLLISRHFGSAT
jgi:hypothetical protein